MLSLDAAWWVSRPWGWRDPFLPSNWRMGNVCGTGGIFHIGGPGVMTGRTWIIAPDIATLNAGGKR